MNDIPETARSLPDTAANIASMFDTQQEILGYARELRALNASTEEDFLSLGLSLGKVSSEVQDVSTLAASVVELVGHEEVERDTLRLRDLSDVIDDHFRQSQLTLKRGGDPLRRMGDMVSEAYKPIYAFRRIVKHLRVLSIFTRIESARLIHDDSSFNILAESVESLSVIIANKSSACFEGLAALHETIKETADKLVTSRAFMEEHAEAMLHSLSSNLSMLSGKHSSSLRTASTLAARSNEVSNGISEVVSSLQFHDITRQQIEHVADIFDEIGAGQSGNGGPCRIMDALGHVGGLQISQLKHAKDELTWAIERVTTNLHQIALHLTDMSTDAATLIGAVGNGDSSFLAELNNSVSLVMSSFVANEETAKSLSAAVRSVTGMVEKLTAFVTDIEDIGSEIELIALNAQIKASGTAEDGGALGVLAGAIRTLSDDAGSQALIMTDTLKGVMNAAQELDALEYDKTSAGRNIHSIHNRMEDILESLGRSQQGLVCSLDELDKKTSGLTRAIEAAVGEITAHDRVGKVIGAILQGLERFLAESPKKAGPAGDSKGDHYLEQLANLYTMEQERHIHESYVSGTDGTPSKAGKSDFGDNVELF